MRVIGTQNGPGILHVTRDPAFRDPFPVSFSPGAIHTLMLTGCPTTTQSQKIRRGLRRGVRMTGQPVSQQKRNRAGTSRAVKRLAAAAPAIRQKFGVTKLGMFGSFARGEQTARSDVDVLVCFAPGCATLHNFICLSDYLEALFKRNVDLLTEDSLSDLIRPYIERDVIWIEG